MTKRKRNARSIFETRRAKVAETSEDYLTPAKVSSSSDCIEFVRKQFGAYFTARDREEFHVIILDTKNQVTSLWRVTIGTLDASLVHPREVFKPALLDSASSVILLHNHPSGDATPSRQDIDVTDRMRDAGKILGIDVLDHIVFGSVDDIRSIEESR